MNHKSNFHKVNEVLANWDPIGVPSNLKLDEYRSYVSNFIEISDDLDGITQELEKIAIDISGYDKTNEAHRTDLILTAKKIQEALKS